MRVIKYFGTRINLIILVVILSIFALVAGLMIGYGVLGDGHAKDVLKPSLWSDVIGKLK